MILNIVTPERQVFSGSADAVVLPGSEGQTGILPKHAPLVSLLKPGELCYIHNGVENFLVVGDGFVEITQDEVTVLTDLAAREIEIDEDFEQQAIERARKALENADHTPEELASVRAALAKSLAKLDLKRRRRV